MSRNKTKPSLLTIAEAPPDVVVSISPLAVDIPTAARLTGVPAWTIREAILTGKLHAKHGGRQHVVQIAELQKWIESLADVEPSSAKSFLARAEGIR